MVSVMNFKGNNMKVYVKASENKLYYIKLYYDNKIYYLWRGNKYSREWTPYKEECETFSREDAEKIISQLQVKDRASGEDYNSKLVHSYTIEEVERV